MKKFNVIETNGGGLVLVTFAEDGETMDYIHSGYEYVPGQLSQDLQELRKGGDPIADEWDGNEIEELGNDFSEIFPDDEEGTGWKCIAEDGLMHYQDMGRAGRFEFPLSQASAEDVAAAIRTDDEWLPELNARLCELADMSDEFEAADDMEFESVVEAAAEKLGVEIY